MAMLFGGQCSPSDQCFCFQILIKCFLDTLIQKTCFLDNKIILFRGELTDISAKKEALHPISSASNDESQVAETSCVGMNMPLKI